MSARSIRCYFWWRTFHAFRTRTLIQNHHFLERTDNLYDAAHFLHHELHYVDALNIFRVRLRALDIFRAQRIALFSNEPTNNLNAADAAEPIGDSETRGIIRPIFRATCC